MGCSFGTAEALEYAKSIGVYTIVTDYNSPEISSLKKIADEFWMIDVANIDALEEKCREKNITGVFAATSEFCLDKAKELCNRLSLPFYAFEEGWNCARDKIRFKQHCIECGLDTPYIWSVSSQLTKEQLNKIQYPVIVKPVDSCAQQGLFVCQNEQELVKGFDIAFNMSDSKRVMIEEYIVGQEIAAFYFFLDGQVILSALDDLVYLPINGRNNFVFVKDSSKFTKMYLDEIDPKVRKLFQQIDCYHGVAFLQGILKDEKIYFLELGYRIDGIGTWKKNKKIYHYSSIEFMVDFSLGCPSMPNRIPDLRKNFQPKPGGIYLLWARPGKIAKIEGVDIINGIESVDIILNRFEIGDEIPKAVSMMQIAFGICISVESKNELKEKVKQVNEALHIYDIEGKNLLFYLTDYNSLD